jgi:hypothetical protein
LQESLADPLAGVAEVFGCGTYENLHESGPLLGNAASTAVSWVKTCGKTAG